MLKKTKTFFTQVCASTMDVSKDLLKSRNDLSQTPFVVMTKHQTSGRGRNGSAWIQAHVNPQMASTTSSQIQCFDHFIDVFERMDILNIDDALPMTLCLPVDLIKIPLGWLPLIVGTALIESFNEMHMFLSNTLSLKNLIAFEDLNIFLKWPNDIIHFEGGASQKCSGILCEGISGSSGVSHVLVGVGVNLFKNPGLTQSTSFMEKIFLKEFSSSRFFMDKRNRYQTIKNFYASFISNLSEYLLYQRKPSQIKDIVLKYMLPVGTVLCVNKNEFKGAFLGLNDDGALILDGVEKPIYSGDVSTQLSIKEPSLGHFIALDMGNTRVHVSYRNQMGLIKNSNIVYDDLNGCVKQEIDFTFGDIIRDLNESKYCELTLAYISVNSEKITHHTLKTIENLILKNVSGVKNVTLLKMTEDHILSGQKINENFDKRTLGADRALKCFFAFNESRKLNKNVLVFSVGTAVTCEGASPSGALIENFVFPGIKMAFSALNHYTALLPKLNPNPDLFEPHNAYWTQSCYMQRGVYFSVCSSIQTALRLHAPCKAYITGGNAHEVLEVLKKMNSSYSSILNDLEYKENFESNILLENVENFLSKTSAEKTENDDAKPTAVDRILESMSKARRRRVEALSYEVQKNIFDYRRLGPRIENISDNTRLDLFLAHKYPFLNREQWRNRVLSGEVFVEHNAPRERTQDNHKAFEKKKPTYNLKNFDQIWFYQNPDEEPEYIEKLDVVYDNKDICVFSKPPNLVIHAAGLYGKNTFIGLAEKQGFKDCAPVHRIDRETSGILVCARTTETRNGLSLQFREQNVKKMYLAITKGPKIKDTFFKIEDPIGIPEKSKIRLKLWVNGLNALPALTYCKHLASFEDYHLIACVPKTGRTNQIRVHLASVGQWIVGDKMYHPNEDVFIEFYEKGFTPFVHENVLFPRHLLHNTAIKFSDIDKQLVVCPFTDDMLDYDVVINLLKNAGMSCDKNNQINEFEKLFIELHELK